jgi:hypothetical protein
MGFVPTASAQTDGPRKFAVTIRNGKADTGSIRVTQGERVEIRLMSDEPAELHLHGYDLLVQVEPGAAATLSFVASIAGRFPLEAHHKGSSAKARGSHAPLFYIDVYPP